MAQEKQINLVNSDFTTVNEKEYPGAVIATGNVEFEHDGAILTCKRAILFPKRNFMQAYGDVYLNQGDTITQTSKYANYDGKTKKAISWGDVVLKDPQMTLTTDTLHFDREKQIVFYKDHGVIRDSINTLESEYGNYYLETNKFQAQTDVVVTGEDHILKSNHLDYYTNSGIAYLHGPSTITNEENSIYCEKGYFNTKTNISYFNKNAEIHYSDRIIEGDSLYYDQNDGFASATGNIKVTDTINNSVVKGNYAELFEVKDSVFITERAVAISVMENDSLYMHGDTLLLTGKPEARKLRAFHHVKIFSKDLKGKCDSIYSDQTSGLTFMYRSPVVWAQGNQITGDTIELISNVKTEQMDSLKVYNNAFVVQKDSAGYTQLSGKKLLGKFKNNDLEIVDMLGFSMSIYYTRDEDGKLIGVDKQESNSLRFIIENNEIVEVQAMGKPEGKTYPLSKFPRELRYLKGFIWRESEKPLIMEDIFIPDDDGEEKSKELTKKLVQE